MSKNNRNPKNTTKNAQATEAVAKVKKPIVSEEIAVLEETVEITPEKEVIVPEIDLSSILASLPEAARKLIEDKLAKAEKKSQPKAEKVLVEVGKVRYLNNKEHEITRRVKIQEADNGEVWVTYLDAYQLSDEELQTLSFKPAYLPYVNTEDAKKDAKKAEKVLYAENAEEIEKEIF